MSNGKNAYLMEERSSNSPPALLKIYVFLEKLL